jgi:dihydrodipicolinate synthase/N-acetylneuraminate lyase
MKKNKTYCGVVIPAVTPLTEDFQLDNKAVENLFQLFYESNTNPFILGTTGEAASIPFSVKKSFLQKGGSLKKKGTQLYAGISSNVFVESVGLAQLAFENGADVVVATLPSYYGLTEKSMILYFTQLADAVAGPLMIYNIPATTHMSIPLTVADELSHHPNIVGLKDSERSIERLEESLKLWRGREDFSHFIGWAAQSTRALLDGSDGLVPSTGNLFPNLYAQLFSAANEGNAEEASRLQKLSDIGGDLYQKGRTLGESLSALKLLMEARGTCSRYTMPPLYPLVQEDEASLLALYNETIDQTELTTIA